MGVGVVNWSHCWAGSGCSSAVGVGLDEVVMVLIVVSVLVAIVVLSHLVVVIVLSVVSIGVSSVVISIGVSSIIRVCLVSWPLISLSTSVRTLFSVVGGGTDLSLCASL